MIWNVFDRDAESRITARNLPHVDQPNALTFVTMRLGDSMPCKVIAKWHQEIEAWLRQRKLGNRSVDDVMRCESVDMNLKNELRQFQQRKWHGHLDDCHGECWLRRPELADEVGRSILHFNANRYDVERFVVMPNHVHVLIQMRSGFDLRKTFREIQRFSARMINKIIKREGQLWQGEPFDHVVRSEIQFGYLQGYIRDNPKKANLREGEFLFWECE